MAIEDAAVLGVLISQMSSRAEIPSRLALFQELRKDRVCAMQIFSRQQQDHASMDEAEKYVKGKLPSKTHPPPYLPPLRSSALIPLQHVRQSTMNLDCDRM